MKHRSLQDRYDESVRTKDGSGRGGSIVFPANTKFFKPKAGERSRIIIVPYTIKTKAHPLVAQGRWDIGDPDYVMDIYVHRYTGPGQQDIVCLKRNYHKACPICEESEKLKEQGDDKGYKSMRPSRRVIYNIIDMDDLDKGVQIFNTSWNLFEHELIDEAISVGGGKPIDFASVEGGKIITFRSSEAKIENNKYLEFKSFSFKDREKPLSKEWLDAAISLDECIKLPSYEEAQEALYGADNDDEDSEDSDHSQNDEEEDTHRSYALKHSHKKDDDDDEEEEDSHSNKDDEEEEKPSRREVRPYVVEDKGDEEEVPHHTRKGRDEEPEEEKPKDGKCPFGHDYPMDWDRQKECAKCTAWDKCGDDYDEKRKLERKNQ